MNVITSIPSVFPDWMRVCLLFHSRSLSPDFNFWCLLFAHTASVSPLLPSFAPRHCGLICHPSFSSFSMCWHIFYLIEYLILYNWNSIHFNYFGANRNSFHRMVSKKKLFCEVFQHCIKLQTHTHTYIIQNGYQESKQKIHFKITNEWNSPKENVQVIIFLVVVIWLKSSSLVCFVSVFLINHLIIFEKQNIQPKITDFGGGL